MMTSITSDVLRYLSYQDRGCPTDQDDQEHGAIMPQKGSFAILPVELYIYIFSFVPFYDLLKNVCFVNKTFHYIVRDDALWKNLFAKRWPKSLQEREEKNRMKRLELEYHKRKKSLQLEYEKKKRELEEDYARRRVLLEREREENNWREIYLRHFTKEQNWRTGKAWVTKIDVGRVINCLLYDEEKDLVISGNHSRDGQGGVIKYWDLKENTCVKTLHAHARWVRGLFSENGKLFSCSNDKTIKVWDLETGLPIRKFSGHTNNVPAIRLSLQQNIMVSCSRDRTVRIWDIEKGVGKTILIGHRFAVNCVLFNSHWVVSGDRGGHVKLWDIKSGTCIKTIRSGLDVVQCMRFISTSGEDARIVLGGGNSRTDETDYPFEVWDLSKELCLSRLKGHKGFNWTMDYDPEYKRLVTGGADRTIRIWKPLDNIDTVMPYSIDSETSYELTVGGAPLRHSDSVYALKFGTFRIVSGSKDKHLMVWSLFDNKQQTTMDGRPQ